MGHRVWRSQWQINAEQIPGGRDGFFADFDAAFSLPGELISKGPTNEVVRTSLHGVGYYVKRYRRGGKWLRRWLGSSRARAEWQNLRLFNDLGIPTPPLVAFGEQRDLRGEQRGVLVLREQPSTVDLATLARGGCPELKSRSWVQGVAHQIAEAVRKLHNNNFCHNDLKWRNILVTRDAAPAVYFIDCPSGRFWLGFFLKRRIIKDLACLDKVAKRHLSRTQRLRFYLSYANKATLDGRDKKIIRQVEDYFGAG